MNYGYLKNDKSLSSGTVSFKCSDFQNEEKCEYENIIFTIASFWRGQQCTLKASLIKLYSSMVWSKLLPKDTFQLGISQYSDLLLLGTLKDLFINF